MSRLVLVALLGLLACSKQEPPPPTAATPVPSAAPVQSTQPPAASGAPTPSAATSTPSATVPAPSAAASTSGEPPTEEDFEDEASRAVTAKSLDSQLDQLEKEIQAD